MAEKFQGAIIGIYHANLNQELSHCHEDTTNMGFDPEAVVRHFFISLLFYNDSESRIGEKRIELDTGNWIG